VIAAVLFDCDGVLADSEHIATEVLLEDLAARGWVMTAEESEARFLGLSLPMMVASVEERVGRLPATWASDLALRLADEMAHRVAPIPFSGEAVAAVVAMGLGHAVGSNSSRGELAAKLARLGLAETFGPRVVSHEDVPRGKPAPDIWLRCAALVGAAPASCVVIEDSLTGVRAARAAGMRVLGYAPPSLSGAGTGAALAAAGAEPFACMSALPGMIERLAAA
jgi:beta-phosphoglucomutase-like phosphatase (HAD superfamily)